MRTIEVIFDDGTLREKIVIEEVPGLGGWLNILDQAVVDMSNYVDTRVQDEH